MADNPSLGQCIMVAVREWHVAEGKRALDTLALWDRVQALCDRADRSDRLAIAASDTGLPKAVCTQEHYERVWGEYYAALDAWRDEEGGG